MTNLPFAQNIEYFATRPFLAGALRFRIGSPSVEGCELVERIFADLPEAQTDSETDEVWFTLSRSEDPAADRWSIGGPVLRELTDVPIAAALSMLVTSVNLAALAAEPERLHLHAACVSQGDRAVVISAASETGKTTTLARLALRGWSYLSDEAVSIGCDDLVLNGWPKPLSVKPGGRDRVSELSHLMLPETHLPGDVLHLPLGAAGVAILPGATASLVVILQRDHAAPCVTPASTDLHPADAVVRLMGETMDAGRYGSRAVFELARLAASCRCVEVLAGTPDDTAALIEDLAQTVANGLPVEWFRASGAIAESVETVMVGDRVVIHETTTGQILALDETATRVWLVLGSWSDDPGIDLDGPVIVGFVEQLRSLGLLAGDDASSGDAP